MSVAGEPRLTADAVVDLYKISLPYGRLYPDIAAILDADNWHLFLVNGLRSPGNTVTFDGDTYEVAAIQMSGDNVQTSDGQKSRPSLEIGLPKLIYGHAVLKAEHQQTGFTGALVCRLRMTKTAFDAGDTAAAVSQLWVVSRIAQSNKVSLSLELRDPLDRFNMKLPAREFEPPDFPTVVSGR